MSVCFESVLMRRVLGIQLSARWQFWRQTQSPVSHPCSLACLPNRQAHTWQVRCTAWLGARPSLIKASALGPCTSAGFWQLRHSISPGPSLPLPLDKAISNGSWVSPKEDSACPWPKEMKCNFSVYPFSAARVSKYLPGSATAAENPKDP